MADYTAADAGDVTFNGCYVDTGTHNGKTYWKIAGVEAYLYWFMGVASGWVIHQALLPPGAPIELCMYYGDESATPDLCAWSVGVGDAPAPAVTEGCGGATHDLTVNSHDSLTPSIVFSPTPDNTPDDSPSVCDFVLNYDENTDITLTAPVSDPAGWHWSGWYIGVALQTSSKGWNYGAITGDETVVATYVRDYDVVVTAADQDASALNVAIVFSPSPDNESDATPSTSPFTLNYDTGTSLTLTAPGTDPTGYRWVGWYIGAALQTAEKAYNFSVVAGVTVIAKYQEVFDVTVEAQDEGDNPLEVSIAFSPSPDNGADTTPSTTEFVLNYDNGTEVTLTAPASDPEGCLWVDWVIDGENVTYEKTYVFDVTEDVTVEAHYAVEYDLTVQATDQNGVALDPGVSIAFSPSPDDAGNSSPRTTEFVAGYAFRTVTLTAPASDPSGYRWLGWYQAGLLQSAAKEWAFSLTKARTVVAVYASGGNIGPPGRARRVEDDTVRKVGAG